jgi:hypothetical protein
MACSAASASSSVLGTTTPARRQTACLDNGQVGKVEQEVARRIKVGKGARVRRGEVVALHELLGEGLGGLKLRCRLRGTKDGKSCLLKGVDDARGKGRFGSHYGEAYVV